jgi:large subunit ribosomal protein L13
MKTSTIAPAPPSWLLLDASDGNLGRIAAAVAFVLRGKHKAEFSAHQVHGDHVVVINAGHLSIPAAKLRRKRYYRHTGYIGSLKEESLGALLDRNPTEALTKAVNGMLPKNKLRKEMLKRLHVFAESEHPYNAQQPSPFPKGILRHTTPPSSDS